jgi:hypothetical protein
MSKRPTKAQVLMRVEEVLAIRLAGAEMPGVREYVREREKDADSPWHLAEGQKPLSDSQLWRYIARADRLMEASIHASRRRHLRRHLARRGELYARAFNAGDYRTALAVLDSQAKLMGLDNAELAAKLAALEKKIQEMRNNGGTGGADAVGGAAGGRPGGVSKAPGQPGPGADAR